MESFQFNATNSAYEIASWIAIFYANDENKKITVSINIERLREIVAAADKDWELLVARDGGVA